MKALAWSVVLGAVYVLFMVQFLYGLCRDR